MNRRAEYLRIQSQLDKDPNNKILKKELRWAYRQYAKKKARYLLFLSAMAIASQTIKSHIDANITPTLPSATVTVQ